MADQLIDVDEAAARIGVSAAEIRRLCRDGGLAAEKIGSRWVIEARSARNAAATIARRRAKVPQSKLDYREALTQVRSELRVQFVPELLRLADLLSDVDATVTALEAMVDRSEYPFAPLHVVDAPKDEVAVRPGTLLSPLDWILFHAAVARVAPSIDSSLAETVYSSRYDRMSRKSLTRPFAKQYAAYQRKSKHLIEVAGYKHVLSTDIVAYYEHIDIDQLYRLFQVHDPDSVSWPIVRDMLRDWQNDTRGIPQGPGASAILGNLYMAPIDRMLAGRPGIAHIRYMDDLRVFSNDRAELVRTAWALQAVARELRLDLKTSKTHIQDSAAFLADIGNSVMDAVNYQMVVDQPEARRTLRKMVRGALRRSGDPDRREVEFGLRRLSRLGDGNLLEEVVNNLDRLATSGSVIASFIAQFPNKELVVGKVTDFLVDTDRNLWPLYEMWLLHAVAAGVRPTPVSLAHHCRQRLTDAGQPWWLRAAALDVLAKEADDPANKAAIRGALRSSTELMFFRQAAAILLQRGLRIRELEAQLNRIPGSDLLQDYLAKDPSVPSGWFSA